MSCALLATLALGLDAGAAAALPVGKLSYFENLPLNGSFNDVIPQAIAPGTEGDLWLTAIDGVELGKATLAGQIEVIEGALSRSVRTLPYGRPLDIAPGADGDMWFTRAGSTPQGEPATPAVIERITPSGGVVVFPLDGLISVAGIAPGPEGDMWFTAQGAKPAMGRISEDGEVRLFSTGLDPDSEPLDIAPGADGDMWFTDQGHTPAIGRVTPSGEITEFSTGLATGSRPRSITPGPEGDLWFTDEGTTVAIGRITPNGEITEFPTGRSAGADEHISGSDIAAGPDGNLWFLALEGHEIGRITPSGEITDYALSPFAKAEAIAPGSDGNMWFTDQSLGGISGVGRIGTGAPSASVSAPTLSGAGEVGQPELCRYATWAAWSSVQPAANLYGFDGYRWLRDGTPIAGATSESYTPTAADAGHSLSCSETVTYPLPFLVSAAATSNTVAIPGLRLTAARQSAPKISDLRQTAKRWREPGSHGGPHAPRVGTTFSFSLNEPADVTFAFTRKLAGRTLAHRCVATDRANRHDPPCTRTVAIATITSSHHSGRNRITYDGEIARHHHLAPGRYTLSVTATNAAHLRSAPASLSFTIVA